jgi:hypothetical protein
MPLLRLAGVCRLGRNHQKSDSKKPEHCLPDAAEAAKSGNLTRDFHYILISEQEAQRA